MKRVLKITATNRGITAKVRIEIESRVGFGSSGTRALSQLVLQEVADGVMDALREATYLEVPLSQQRVGR